MANWQRNVKLNPEWDAVDTDDVKSIQDLCKSIVSKLKALDSFNDEDIDSERDEIVEEFEALSTDGDADVESFDEIMSRLYDWGDNSLDRKFNGRKVCFIDTFSKVK